MSLFNAGDVVRLNSGGSELTVNQTNGPNVSVIWIANNEDGRYGQATFPAVCFTLVRRQTDKHDAIKSWEKE